MTAPPVQPRYVSPSELISSAANLTRTGLELWSAALGAAPKSSQDPLRLNQASAAFVASLMRNPSQIARIQVDVWADYLALASRFVSADAAPPAQNVAPSDRRFRDEAWEQNPMFQALKQTYLIHVKAARALVRDATGLDEDVKERLGFAVEQILDALAPTNFAISNPKVLRESLDSGGRNLIDGLNNLLDDLRENGGRFDIPMTEKGAFRVGEDLASTPGKVVYQNELMQLIQYDASTDKVNRRPLLVVPPWMNKFYILDLRPGNSYIEWLVDQGHTVFVVSWVNPGRELAHKSFEDYMLEGPLAALDAIAEATGEREVNVVGYCLGGILVSAALAYLKAKKDDRIRSATLLTTMVDFREAGEVCMFLDPEALDDLEKTIQAQGYLDGRSVYDTFRALRANDLIWSFHVNNYLMGNKPAAFDLLHWNADSTNMPAAMHTYFMRNMYVENRMREPGGIELAGVPIDVSTIKTPTYVLSTVDDHIAPWRTTYYTTALFGGPVKFVLGESGHIAGVVNPPAREKYGYFVNNEAPAEPEQWLAGAKREAGSWWPDWSKWMSRHLGGKVAARVPGDGALPVIEDAPGSYVMQTLSN